MKQITYIALFLFCALNIQAQDVTYSPDPVKRNQITVMEDGFGSLDNFYYTVFHNKYSKTAYTYPKNAERALAYGSAHLQVDKADSIKSYFVERGKREAENLLDRNVDLVWITEKGRVNEALLRLKRNVDRIGELGAPSSERKFWNDKYNRLEWSIGAMREGYMPNSERKKQFVALYGDILTANRHAVNRSVQLYFARKMEQQRVKKQKRTQSIHNIALKAHNDWCSKFMIKQQ